MNKGKKRNWAKILTFILIINYTFCILGPECGSGSVHLFSEDCDDGNTSNNDGCDSNCELEPGFNCSGTGVGDRTTCSPICSDGQTRGTEQCDDNNGNNGDGCSSSCTIESGWACTGTGIGQNSNCDPVCGDWVNKGSEGCDDGDSSGGDGCSNSCQIESGWECPTHNPSVCNLICSNGRLDSGEVCDDANTSDNDGCSSSCQIEPDYECFGSPSVCNLICSNGRLDSGETCDDGNLDDNDGCSANCQVEPDYECFGSPSACNLICSNGRIDPGETCDDGNLNNNDGCSSLCQIETGYACNGQPSICDGICGDSLIRGTEECDDSDLINDNGCSDECKIETGFSCTGEPSTCIDICGDSLIVTTTQECDDGGNDNDDGCSHDCVIETGWVCENVPSECDPICGDGLVRGSEKCDDGNHNINDGCNNFCEIESGWSCSGEPSICNPIFLDGLVVGDEECDDENSEDRDGCTPESKQEEFYNCTGQPSICEKVPSKVLSETEQLTGSVIQNSVTSSFAIGIGLSFLINIPTSSLWSLINTLQILHYIPMFNLYFPSNVLKLFTFLGISNMQNEYLSSLFLKHVNEDELSHHTEVSYRYANQGYESTSVLINSPDTLSFIVLFTIYYGIIVLAYLEMKYCHPKIENSFWLTKKIYNFITNEAENLWMNIIIRIALEVFLDLTFSSILNLRYFDTRNGTDIYSSVMAILISIIMLIFTITIFILCICKMIDPIHVPMIKLIEFPRSKDDVLFKEIKPENRTTPFIHIAFLLQRIILIWLIIESELNGTLQIILFSFITFLKSLYLLISRPYTSTPSNIQDIIGEIILFLTCTLFTQFSNPISEFITSGRPYILGFICISLIMSPIIIFYIIILTQTIAKFFKKGKGKVEDLGKRKIAVTGVKMRKIERSIREVKVTPVIGENTRESMKVNTTMNSRYLDRSLDIMNIKMS